MLAHRKHSLSRFWHYSALRASALRLRWRAVRAVAPRRTVQSRGLRFTLQCENWITHYRWESYNGKEPETLDWIDNWLRDSDIFFDIGANIGVYTIYAALRHPHIKVIAFEPEYSNLHLLRDNIIENSLEGRVEIYSIALSNSSGLSHLHIQDLTPGTALHTESRDTLQRTLTSHPVLWREGVYTLTLDEFCRQALLQPNCVKLDVDGTEEKVLEGAAQTFCSPGLRSVIVELPEGEGVRLRCEKILRASGLCREWHDPLGRSPNEIWVRQSRGAMFESDQERGAQ